ncbi:MAG: CCA tRNA nucleotidyltransferase [Candidatus Methylarchaceae archaeon HK02M2]|nr:CCA tRNA nucleotidyltransferase [Candidatus Methylarchaceae archaeon HK02M2]
MSKVLSNALKIVEPAEEEVNHVKSIANRAFKRVSKVASKSKYKPDVVFGGSYAKGTWLKGEADIDIFVRFPESLNKADLKKYGLDVALESMKDYAPILRYAEHPYVEAYIEDVGVNVVPCYDVKKWEWKSAADRSPYHTTFMIKELKDQLVREVRLLKKFMKGVGVYGAEISTQGFSGYVCEVLLLKYGSFISTIKSVSRWREREVISLEKINKDIQKRFQKASVIILDPIDLRRNLGTAVSLKKLAEFILASRTFLEKPSLRYFVDEKDRLEKIEKSELMRNLVTLKFKHNKRSVDVLWGQLKKSLSYIRKQLDLYDFKVLRATCITDGNMESAFIFLMENLEQPEIENKKGPEVFRYQESKKFIAKNLKKSKLIWLGDDTRVYALMDRRFKDIYQLFIFLLSVKKGMGIASGLKDDIVATYKIYLGDENTKLLSISWIKKELIRLLSSDRLLTMK